VHGRHSSECSFDSSASLSAPGKTRTSERFFVNVDAGHTLSASKHNQFTTGRHRR
jgi:hypothetical protein